MSIETTSTTTKENIAGKRAYTVVFWIAEAVTGENFAKLPEWIQGKLKNGDVYVTHTTNWNTFQEEYTIHFRTILGFKECPIGDYLILDGDYLYSLTPEAFNRIFKVEE